MNLKQLEYFVAIAEEHQITAAARRLGISQPPLSYELASLERELGVTLVKRGARKAELTDAGWLLYERARRILAMTSAAEREVANYGSGFRGVLSIGTVSSSGCTVPNESMLEFAHSYPEVRFEVHEGNTFEVIDLLDKGIVDVGVVRMPFSAPQMEVRYAKPEPMLAVMPHGLVCGEKPDSVTLAELAEQPLVFYRRYQDLIRETFSASGLSPFVSCVNEDARTTCIWAAKGFGVGIVPSSIFSAMNGENLVGKRIDSDALVTRIAIIWERGRYLSPLAKRFIELFDGTR